MQIFFSRYSGIIDICELLVSLFSFIGGTEDIDNAKAVLKFLLQWFDGLASDHDTLLIDQMGKFLAFKIPKYLFIELCKSGCLKANLYDKTPKFSDVLNHMQFFFSITSI